MKNGLSVKSVLGSPDQPNEGFGRVGMAAVLIGSLAKLEFTGLGVEFGDLSNSATTLVLLVGVFLMLYGAYLKKNLHAANQRHELELAKLEKIERESPK